MDWTGLDLNPVDWALYQPVWPESGLAGVHWSPLESTWITWGRVKTSKEATAQGQQRQGGTNVERRHDQDMTCNDNKEAMMTHVKMATR